MMKIQKALLISTEKVAKSREGDNQRWLTRWPRTAAEYTGGERTICGGGGETESRSKNNSAVQIGTTTTGNPPSCDTVISFDGSAERLCVCVCPHRQAD